MKKTLTLIFVLTLVACTLVSCKHEHKFAEWSVTKNATCTEDGVKTRYCDCGEKQSDTIPADGHKEQILAAKEATCTETGLTEGKHCSVCGEIFVEQEIVNKKPHTEEIIPRVEPTCTESGLTEGKKCAVCKNTTVEQENIPALDHDKRTYTEKDENCNVYNVTVCDRENCDYMDRSATGVVSHAFGEWERVNNITGSPCGIDKIYNRTCDDCRATETKTEASPNHNYKATVISVHNFDSATDVATIGESKYECQNDGCDSTYYEYEYHTYSQKVIGSTCSEQGYTLNTCSCGHSYKSDFTDKLPHTSGAVATCTTAQSCTECPEIITPVLGHDWKEATCTEPKTCQRIGCGAIDGKANGHTEVVDAAIEATCTETGLTEGKHCSVCGEIIVAQASVKANGHNFENHVCLTCGRKDYSEGLEFISNGDGTCYVSGIGTCTDTYVIIQSVSPAGDRVIQIGSEAFYNRTSLTSIVIPDSVTSIGDRAFWNCSSLTSVTIGNSVKSIGSYAFEDCNSLTSVVIGNGVTEIGNSAFYGCSSLTSIVIPKGVTSIGDDAFSWCSSLESIVIPDSVTSIGNFAFLNCSSLTSIEIPDSVTSIGVCAFCNCSSLTNIEVDENNKYYTSIDGNLYTKDETTLIQYAIGKTNTEFIIPDSVTSIGEDAFYWCTSLTSIEIPDSVISIGDDAFWKCSSLTSIEIPDSVTSIGEYAFYYCISLTSIVIPDSVTSIGNGAFRNCSSLTSIVIPKGVTSIGDDAFYDCYKLVEVVNNSSLNITKGSSNNGGVGCYAIEVHTGESKIVNKDGYLFYTYDGVNYLVNYIGEEKNITLPESYNGEKYIINNFAFFNCSSLTSVTIGNGVTSIGYGAFSYCSSLTSVEIPDSVTSIGDSAFLYCNSLTSVEIPDSVTSIGICAFGGCSSLTSIVIPDSVTSIGDYAFEGCQSLKFNEYSDGYYLGNQNNPYDVFVKTKNSSITSCNIHPSTKIIAYAAFANCDSLTSVVIPNSVTSIGTSAFANCTSLTSILIPDSVTSIDWYAFYGCSSLTSIVIPDSVTSIGSSAFYGCKSLASITLPDSDTSIGFEAFHNTAYYNNEANWENGVLYIGKHLIGAKDNLAGNYNIKAGILIGDGAFLGCSSLTSITIPDSITSISPGAFLGCSSLTSITIPDGVTIIYEGTFYLCSSLTDVYFTGTEEQWNAIGIDIFGNNYLTSATIHYNHKP